jgi:hypothetical protein
MSLAVTPKILAGKCATKAEQTEAIRKYEVNDRSFLKKHSSPRRVTDTIKTNPV